MRTLIKNGWIWRGEETSVEPEPEDVLIENGRIVSVGLLSGVADADVIDAAGMLVMPGLVNAHFHSPVNHMKGALPSLPLELFMLYEYTANEALRPTPREAYVTLLACLEMIRNGVTAVQDDAFLFLTQSRPSLTLSCKPMKTAGFGPRGAGSIGRGGSR